MADRSYFVAGVQHLEDDLRVRLVVTLDDGLVRDVVRALLESGKADANKATNDGLTPLLVGVEAFVAAHVRAC